MQRAVWCVPARSAELDDRLEAFLTTTANELGLRFWSVGRTLPQLGRAYQPGLQEVDLRSPIHWRFTSFSFVICPSVWPLDQGSMMAALGIERALPCPEDIRTLTATDLANEFTAVSSSTDDLLEWHCVSASARRLARIATIAILCARYVAARRIRSGCSRARTCINVTFPRRPLLGASLLALWPT